MRIRHNLYLEVALSDTLEILASRPGGSKSRIVSDALRAWFASRASRDLDDMVRTRLDRISRELGQTRRDTEVLLESLSLFIRYQLTVTAPIPEADHIARAVGRDRFEAFVAQVGRQIAGGKRSIGRNNEPEQSQ